MPATFDRYAAFNFLGTDEILPVADGSIDANDRAQLLGAYLLGKAYIEVLDEQEKIFDYGGQATYYVDHETGDTSQYDTAPGSGSVVSPGLNSTSYKFRQTIPQTGTGRKNVSIESGVIVVTAYIDTSGMSGTVSSSKEAGLSIYKSSSGLFSTNLISSTSIYISYTYDIPPVYNNFLSPWTITAGEHKLEVRIWRGSTGAAVDGRVEFYIDGSLQHGTDRDIDAQFDQIETARLGNAQITSGASGTIDFDELFIYDGIPFAIYLLGRIRIITETVNISELILPVLSYVRVLIETVDLVESIINPRILVRIVSEVVNLVESIINPRILVRIVSEVVDLVESIIRILGLIRIIDETVHILLVGESDIVIDHETGDTSQYDTPPDDTTITTPGYNSTSYRAQIAATQATAGVKAFTSPTGSFLGVSFYMDVSGLTYAATGDHVIGIRVSAGGTTVLWTKINGEVSPYTFAVTIKDDNDAESSTTPSSITDTVHKYELKLYKATTVVSADGRLELYIDDALEDTINGLDTYTYFAALDSVEIGNMDIPAMDGSFDIDEIKITSTSSFAIYVFTTLTFLVEVISETVDIVTSTVKVSGFIRVISETVDLVETIRRIQGFIQVIDETLNISESVQGALGLIKIISETINLVEARQYVLGLFKVISETVNLAESIVRLTPFIRIISETINLVESTVRPRGLIRVLETDYIHIVESKLRIRSLVRIISEVVNISETIVRLKEMVRVISETVNLVEAVQYLLGAVKVVSETINVTTGIVRRSAIVRVVEETVNLVETIISPRAIVRIIETEYVKISENILKLRGLIRIISETVNIISSILYEKGASFVQVVSETVNIVTGTVRLSGLIRIKNETINIVETALGLRGLKRVISETVNLVETIIRPRGLIRVLETDYIHIVESKLRIRGLVKIISGTINVIESIVRLKVMTRVVSEIVNIVESILGSPVLYTLAFISRAGVKITGILTGVVISGVKTGIQIVGNRTGVKID